MQGLSEAGVRITFSNAEIEVSLKRELPTWWKQFPLELRSQMISLGWDNDRIAYLRPCRIPKHLIELAAQYGYRYCYQSIKTYKIYHLDFFRTFF